MNALTETLSNKHDTPKEIDKINIHSLYEN